MLRNYIEIINEVFITKETFYAVLVVLAIIVLILFISALNKKIRSIKIKKMSRNLGLIFKERIFDISFKTYIYEPIFNLTEGLYKEKYFVIFDYWWDPLTLFYIPGWDYADNKNGTFINGIFYENVNSEIIKDIISGNTSRYHNKINNNVSYKPNKKLFAILIYTELKINKQEILLNMIIKNIDNFSENNHSFKEALTANGKIEDINKIIESFIKYLSESGMDIDLESMEKIFKKSLIW